MNQFLYEKYDLYTFLHPLLPFFPPLPSFFLFLVLWKDEEKIFDKSQYSFMIKIHSKVSTERNFFYSIKGVSSMLSANTILNDETFIIVTL